MFPVNNFINLLRSKKYLESVSDTIKKFHEVFRIHE
jgi:hypothetical protein